MLLSGRGETKKNINSESSSVGCVATLQRFSYDVKVLGKRLGRVVKLYGNTIELIAGVIRFSIKIILISVRSASMKISSLIPRILSMTRITTSFLSSL